ncbi:MAG: ArsA-related P-loop ATPase [Actinomycetes bacterium]
MSTVETICAKSQVIVTCGTGGVGKTSVAAALGTIAALSGRRVVVITIDPARRLADAIGLGDQLGNEPQRISLDATGELWVCMLDVRETFDNLVRDISPSTQSTEEVMNNSFYRNLSRSLSGTRDYMAAERLHELQVDGSIDLVIVDTPPSRNALDFLESPERLARFLKHPIVRLLAAPGRGGLRFANAALTPVLKIISSVVGSDALTGVASFLKVIDGMEDEFSRRALAVAATLRSNATSFVVVTAPAPDALIEADHFVSELKRLGISLGLIVTNRMPPRFGDSSSSTEQTAAASTSGDLAVAHHVLAELWRDVEQAEAGVQAFLSRTNSLLGAVDTASATEFATDIHDMASIGLLAQQLAATPPRQ